MTAFIGKSFLSVEGREQLKEMRVGAAPPCTHGPAPIRLLARVPSEECGCPEEVWIIDGLILLMHFEEDGSSDVFIFAGDWEEEGNVYARSLDDLRAKAFQWFADIMDRANDGD